MANLKQIKIKIRAVGKTRQVTKAMEAVSAAKMRKAQASALSGRVYARAAASVLRRLSSGSIERHSLMQERKIRKGLYIVITSDKGLAGNLNNGVLRAAHADIARLGLTPASAVIVPAGRKAAEFFKKRGFVVEERALDERFIDEIAHERFAREEIDVVKVAYQNFVSTFEQRPTVRTIFPLSAKELDSVVADIIPKYGKYAQLGAEGSAPANYTVEPSEVEVLDTILPKLANIILHHALLEAQASEHSARMVAMKSASDKAVELTHMLTVRFNKARQAAITREVSEITGGMESLAH